MNGPEHYREAERLVDAAQNQGTDLLQQFAGRGSATTLSVGAEIFAGMVAVAQVHATLANAAATEQLAAAVENLPTYEGMLAVYAFGVNPR